MNERGERGANEVRASNANGAAVSKATREVWGNNNAVRRGRFVAGNPPATAESAGVAYRGCRADRRGSRKAVLAEY